MSFDVSENEVFGIIGLNGAGKSSIIKILMGLTQADEGIALLNGQASKNTTGKRSLGYLPENPCLYPNLTLKEHLNFACQVGEIKASERGERIKRAISQVDLHNVENTPIRQFSKGMTQRAALAYALIHTPSILILDEPMSGLDPLGRQLIIKIIEECKNRGTTILFCSHILTDVERICDRIGIMHQGKLMSTTTPLQLSEFKTDNSTGIARTPLEMYFLKTIGRGEL
ncbi:ABC transporter ATP-binding protein [Desulfosediminicola sp.]|uniref:ABC transporter ATP-binding protein n=1 Tax=Desulfosediminicola sp. TaxID=2886825 RepID=UPI003AF30D5A